MKTLIYVSLLLWLPTIIMDFPEDPNFFYWRHQLTILTGFIGFACMTVSVILALRLKWVEDKLHGLDKGYALHKHMGIGALVALVLHWVIIESPKWLIALELLARPNRKHREVVEGINWTHLSKMVGEYSFYVFVIFAAISLIQLISYRKFKFIHNIAGAIFIAGAFHSVIIMDIKWPAVAIDAVIIALSIIGVIASLISLTGNIGKKNRSEGEISAYNVLENSSQTKRVLHLSIRLQRPLQYREGQFAYLNFHDGEAPHPFSILNYDQQNQVIEFAIKELGDYTTKLIQSISSLNRVTVEGGYGRFYIPAEKTQVWIGAGVGIVPFIGWLNWMGKATAHKDKSVKLFYCRHSSTETYFETILKNLLQPLKNIQLNVITSESGERFSADNLTKQMELNDSVAVRFCGPTKFADQLAKDLSRLGLPEANFHSEQFKMR